MRFYPILALTAVFLVAAEAPKDYQADRAKLQDTVTTLEKQGWEALKKQDVEAFKKLTADDFVGTFGDGSRVTKTELVKLLPDFRITDYALEDVKMLRFNQGAVMLTFKAVYDSELKGEKAKNSVLASSGWVQRDGTWLNVFYQETPVKK
jgi:hypothetical protein